MDKIFVDFFISVTIFLHNNWIGPRLSSSNNEWTSFLTSCQTTQIRRFQENLWKTWNWWQVHNCQTKNQILIVMLEHGKKSSIKHFKETSILFNYANFFTIFHPWLMVGWLHRARWSLVAVLLYCILIDWCSTQPFLAINQI